MAEKPEIKIGYLKITDHLILGVTDLKLKKGMEKFEHCTLEPVLKNGWNEVADALSVKSLDGAFLLAPTAMDMFKAGVDLKLLLYRIHYRPSPGLPVSMICWGTRWNNFSFQHFEYP